jgi:hypothetical protein
MTVEEFNKRLTKLEKDIIGKLPGQFIQAKAGFDISAMVSDRVIQKSMSGDNTHFSAYSTRPMLTSGTTAKSQNVWRGKKDKKWVTIKKGAKNIHLFVLEGGYAEMRRLEGFSNRFKNFWFTTEMWRKFGLKRTTKNRNGFRLVFGGLTPEAQKKIDANTQREGKNILEMTKREVNSINANVSLWIDNMLRKNRI